MKTKLLLLICALSFTLVGFSRNETIKGNGKLVTKKINIENYTSISIAGSVEFIYEQASGKPYFEVTIDENVFSYLDVSVKGDKLTVGWKDNKNKNIQPTKFKIKTNSAGLNQFSAAGSGRYNLSKLNNAGKIEMNLSGSGNLNLQQVKCDNLGISLAGSCKVDAEEIHVGKIDCRMSGSSNVELFGKADRGDFVSSGSCSIKAFDFEVGDLNTASSGSGKMEVNASRKLKVAISGSASVNYKGNAEIGEVSISGSGKIKKVE